MPTLKLVSNVQIEEPAPKHVRENQSNNNRIAGNAKVIVARRGKYRQYCTFCSQLIEPGTLYVKQDRWLFYKRAWFQPGNRHYGCWSLEEQYHHG